MCTVKSCWCALPDTHHLLGQLLVHQIGFCLSILQVEETTELIAVQLAGLAAASALMTAPEIFSTLQVWL